MYLIFFFLNYHLHVINIAWYGSLISGLLLCRAAVACIGGMYERLGRMVGRSYEETIQILIKALKNAEVCLDLITIYKRLNNYRI